MRIGPLRAALVGVLGACAATAAGGTGSEPESPAQPLRLSAAPAVAPPAPPPAAVGPALLGDFDRKRAPSAGPSRPERATTEIDPEAYVLMLASVAALGVIVRRRRP